MQELTALLEAVANLVAALGPMWTAALVAGLIGYHEFREWRKGRLERSIADEKERVIQRLADDNRWMRRVLMSKAMDLTEPEIEKLMGEGQPKPLLSERKGAKR